MKKAIIILFFITPFIAGANSLKAIEDDQQELFKKIAPAVVFISSGKSFGSGFFISSRGLILTNAHVVGKSNTVTVVTNSGEKLNGKVIERGLASADVALVKVEKTDAVFLTIKEKTDIKVGSWVGSVGHGEGAIWTFNSGMISNIYPDGNDRPVFQTQIPLNPGNSGGPIFDYNGELVGIVTSGIAKSNSINFGIRIEYTIRYLEILAKKFGYIIIKAPEGVPVFIDGKVQGKGPLVAIPGKKKTYEIFVVVDGKMVKKTFSYPDENIVELK